MSNETELRAERDRYRMALERVERECKVYKQALERYATGNHGRIAVIACVALETGKKLKGES